MSDAKKHHDMKKSPVKKKRVVRLDDLDWQDEVTGGSSGKLFFGERPDMGTASGKLLKPDNKSQGGKGT